MILAAFQAGEERGAEIGEHAHYGAIVLISFLAVSVGSGWLSLCSRRRGQLLAERGVLRPMEFRKTRERRRFLL